MPWAASWRLRGFRFLHLADGPAGLPAASGTAGRWLTAAWRRSGLARLSGALLGASLAACSESPQPLREPLQRFEVPGADLERGKAVMSQYQCGSCHRIPGVPGDSRLAPGLADFGRRSYIAGQWPNTPEGLQQWLIDPPAVVPGTTMPRLGVSKADARDMAGYLMSLQ